MVREDFDTGDTELAIFIKNRKKNCFLKVLLKFSEYLDHKKFLIVSTNQRDLWNVIVARRASTSIRQVS
jgi:hypothetical protein